ncbi:MAG TPA: TIGR03118 family protein [Bryobacteraceae bacterium]|jgi:uncharacterized protein (TIGR03118 family)|nr:TIGR03118 family protein [Bryobacteraceae bacterium]
MKTSTIALARLILGAALSCCTFLSAQTSPNTYLVHNLVSDLPDTADFQDTHLVNPWGVAASATGPFWIGNNGTGTSTLYTTNGTANALVVTIPAPTVPTGGAVTGVVSNSTTSFPVTSGATTKASSFIFCTEDGTISGWSPTVNATNAIIAVNQSAAGSVFKACAAGGTATAPVLYVTDFHNGAVDMFDGSFKPIVSSTAFTDATIPAGFAPFGLSIIGGNIYVSYAKQDSAKHDDVAGAGNGFIDAFDASGNLLGRLVSQGVLNSPWGMAKAPATFGAFGGALLVGNFGDGTINAFDSVKGTPLGTLKDDTGHAIPIPGVWTLSFGNGGRGGDSGTLYFTAGIPGPYGEDAESHGLFGSIQAVPSFTNLSVVNGGSFAPSIAGNTWVDIFGGGLAATIRSWAATDFVGTKLPVVIDGVTVLVNNEAAAISYVSPNQVNVLIPSDIPAGPVTVQINNNGEVSAAVSMTAQATAPAFFTFTGNKYIAATHANGSLTGPATLITGQTTPVTKGETVVLYGTGFGATAPATPNGSLLAAALTLAAPPAVTVGGVPATVAYAGLVEPGLYQLNVVVPATAASGDAAVIATTSSGQQSQGGAFISIQ